MSSHSRRRVEGRGHGAARTPLPPAFRQILTKSTLKILLHYNVIKPESKLSMSSNINAVGQPEISRRQALLFLAGLALARPVGAFQSLPRELPSPELPSPPATSGLKPYDMIEPPVAGEARHVRLFFTYDCPYCRQYHNGLIQWGQSLPKPLQFTAIPIITSPENDNQTLAVYGRLIAQALDPKVLPRYDLAVFNRLQGDTLGPSSGVGELTTSHVLSALVESGIAAERVTAFLESDKMDAVESRIPNHAKAITTYQIKATPTIVISGRFAVNPDHANGNASQFLTLLNGIVSRALEARGEHAA